MINIDYRDSRPIYEQIAEGIENLIARGVLEADSQLPSVRQLASELSINPNTIQRAYAELETREIIYTVRGRGNFVSPDANKLKERKLMVLANDVKKLVKTAISSGVNLTEIEKTLLNIIQDCRKEGHND